MLTEVNRSALSCLADSELDFSDVLIAAVDSDGSSYVSFGSIAWKTVHATLKLFARLGSAS